MMDTSAIIAICIEIAMILCGLLVKQFYQAKGENGAVLSDRKIPQWQGRILFIGIGIVFLIIGIRFLVLGN